MPHRQGRRPVRPGRSRRGACTLALVATWVLAFVGGAAGGHVHPAVPSSPLPAIVLVGLLVVVAIPVAGFTCAMTALVVAGVRRVRSVEDVGQLMSGAAGAYRDVFSRTADQVSSADRQVRAEEAVRSPENLDRFHAHDLHAHAADADRPETDRPDAGQLRTPLAVTGPGQRPQRAGCTAPPARSGPETRVRA